MNGRIEKCTNKILITGGAGFIGSELAESLIKNNDNFVVIVDNLSTGCIEKLPSKEYSNWHFNKCDVNNYQDISEVMLAYKFDYVFHYAAVVGVLRTQLYPVNVLHDLHGIENILKLSKSTGVKRVFYSSSSEIYGEPVELPQHEHTTPLNSRLPYAIVKNIGEAFLRSYHQEYNLNFTIFRFFNTYGKKQSKDFVISKFIHNALKNEDITINGDGTQTRTFCNVTDNVEACLNAFYNNKFINDVVNIGGNKEIKIIDLAKIIIQLTKSKSKIVHLPPLKDGDMTRRLPDISKMNELIKNKPIKLEDGIKSILNNLEFIL